jgi:pSer/pThr/pTyr-binding forkhead associated (FHA) protein
MGFTLQQVQSQGYRRAYSLGSSKKSDIFVRDTAVSREHAILNVFNDGSIRIVDQGSGRLADYRENGTFVRGKKIKQKKLVTLSPGEGFNLGTEEIYGACGTLATQQRWYRPRHTKYT